MNLKFYLFLFSFLAVLVQARGQFTSSISKTDASCFGICNGTATVNPSGGTTPYTFSWAPSGGTGATASGLCAGNYTCTITDNSSSVITRTVSVIQPAAPVSGNTVITNVACFGGSTGAINLTATGGTGPYTFNWLPSGPTTEDRTGLTAGTKSVQITDANGCTGTVTASVTQPSAPVSGSTVITNVACFGGSTGAINLTPSGGAGPYTFNWLPSGPTTEDRTGLTAGTKSVQITDDNGCTGTVTATVTQPTAPVSGNTVITNVACFGGNTGAINLTATGGTGPYTFNWLPSGPTTEDRTGLTAGTKSVQITDDNGCTGTVTANVTQPAAPVSGSTVVIHVACFGGTNGAINLTGSGGVGAYTFNWLPSGPTTEDRTGLAAGTYSVQLMDANGCTGTVTATVNQPSAPVSGSTVVTHVACFGGNTGAINLTATGGIGPYTFNWLPSGPTTEDRTGLAAGTKSVQITDANGCTGTVTANVTQPSVPVSGSAVVTHVACFGGTTGAINFTPSGGTPGYTYNWGGGITTQDRTGLAAGTYSVQLMDANGCTGTVTTTVTQPATAGTTWLGSTTAWDSASNWTCGIPTSATDVVIDGNGITNMPVITTAASAKNITLTNGGTLTFGTGGTLDIDGNVTGPGLDAANGAVSYTGSTAQTGPGFSAASLNITNTAGVSFTGPVTITGDFVMNGSGGLSTGSAITVGGILTLTSGNITLGSGNLAATTLSGGSASSYVVTNGTGTLDAPVANGATVKFPVGRTAYNPVTLNNTGNAELFSVRVYDGVTVDGAEGGVQIPQSSKAHVGITWLIDDVNNAGAVVAMTLQFNDGQQSFMYFDMNHTYLAHYSAALGKWHDFRMATPNQQAATVAPGVYSVTNTISDFSPFTITSNGLNGSQSLPVNIAGISAHNEGRVNVISWQSAEEKGLASYEVERSTDGRSFRMFEKTAPQGQPSSYTVYDRNAADGMNYYRLKMADVNGDIAYSKTVYAFVSGNGAFVMKAFPQPATHTLNIEVFGGAGDAVAYLTDITGAVLMPVHITGGKAVADMSGLSAGVYFIRYKDSVRQQTLKITKE